MTERPKRPVILELRDEDLRDRFCKSMLWAKQANRTAFREREEIERKNSLLSGGVGCVWRIGFNSTGRWMPHTLVWRLKEPNARKGLVVIFRERSDGSREVRVRFSTSRLVSIKELSSDLLPNKDTMPSDARPCCLKVEASAKSFRYFGIVFSEHAEIRAFLTWVRQCCAGVAVSSLLE